LDASYGIQNVLVSEGAQTSEILQGIAEAVNAPLTPVRAGYKVKLENLEIRALWPLSAVSDPSANASCLSTLIVDTTPDAQDAVEDDVVLTTGDAESSSVNAALDAAVDLPDIDVLKVPHHGSKISVNEALFTKIHPHIAVISCGLNNRYGHPRPEPLALLKRFVPEVKRTDLDGNVVLAL
jgi:competence protein ComEC